MLNEAKFLIAPYRDDHPAPVQEERKLSPVLFIIIILIVLCVVGVMIYNSTQKIPEDMSTTAFFMCQHFVTEQLKAPKTAEFAPQNRSDITKTDSDSYRIVSYVDAQNSFGAMIRTSYTCTVDYQGSDQWRLVDLQTSP